MAEPNGFMEYRFDRPIPHFKQAPLSLYVLNPLISITNSHEHIAYVVVECKTKYLSDFFLVQNRKYFYTPNKPTTSTMNIPIQHH